MNWLELADTADYKGIAQALLSECDSVDFTLLRSDPWAALDAMPALTIVVQDDLPSGACGGGYYDRSTATIYVHPASPRRNNFTLLHEYGHHLQQNHEEWAYVLLDDVHPLNRRKVEEQVCDQIASEILLSSVAEEHVDPFVQSPALVMAHLFENSGASRSATLRHVAAALKHQTKWILVVANSEGRVQAAECTYEQFPPKRGMIQPGFARLATEAESGLVRRNFVEGMVYQGGRELHEMKVEAVLDHTGAYAFLALTPIERFGLGTIASAWYSCDRNGCATEDYCAEPDSEWCEACKEPRCLGCGDCRCERTVQASRCSTCYVTITEYEAANGLHECW